MPRRAHARASSPGTSPPRRRASTSASGVSVAIVSTLEATSGGNASSRESTHVTEQGTCPRTLPARGRRVPRRRARSGNPRGAVESMNQCSIASAATLSSGGEMGSNVTVATPPQHWPRLAPSTNRGCQRPAAPPIRQLSARDIDGRALEVTAADGADAHARGDDQHPRSCRTRHRASSTDRRRVTGRQPPHGSPARGTHGHLGAVRRSPHARTRSSAPAVRRARCGRARCCSRVALTASIARRIASGVAGAVSGGANAIIADSSRSHRGWRRTPRTAAAAAARRPPSSGRSCPRHWRCRRCDRASSADRPDSR